MLEFISVVLLVGIVLVMLSLSTSITVKLITAYLRCENETSKSALHCSNFVVAMTAPWVIAAVGATQGFLQGLFVLGVCVAVILAVGPVGIVSINAIKFTWLGIELASNSVVKGCLRVIERHDEHTKD